MISNTPGAISSHRNSGCEKRTLLRSNVGNMARRRGSGCGVRDSSGAIPDSRIPNPEALSFADFLPALASFGIVLALVAALRDDDLELAHVGLRGRPPRMAVQRRPAGQIRRLHRRLLWRGGLG